MPEAKPHPATAETPPDRAAALASLLDGLAGLDRLELIALLRADQQRRWQAGQHLPAEDYLRDVAALRDDPDLAIDLIFSEFLLRRDELRKAPAFDEYLRRFPQHATVLRRRLELDAFASEAVHTQGRGAAAPATAAAPPEAADWTVLGPGGDSAGPTPAAAPACPATRSWSELGRGGMGVVYKARQTDAEPPRRPEDDPGRRALPEQQELARFRSRGRGGGPLAAPQHRADLRGRRARTAGPTSALEFVEGGSLAERLDGTPLAARPGRAELVETLARAVARRPPARHRPPRPQAGQRAADGRRHAQDHRLRPGQAAGRAGGGPGRQHRRDPGHAQLHGARAGRRQSQARSARPPTSTPWGPSSTSC